MIASTTAATSSRRRLSRYGCRNCKLRKLKCDETRPQCEKCHKYGVRCNFEYGVGDLKPLAQNCITPEAAKKSFAYVLAPRLPISTATWTSNDNTCYTLDVQDKELFRRFRLRTIQTLGGPEIASIYETHILEMSFNYPCLMHGILAIAAAHDRYLGTQSTHRRTIREASHAYQCVSLFNKCLSQSCNSTDDKDNDAIWATAVVLAILSFSSIDVASVQEAWPLGNRDVSALDWLRIKSSDQALWGLALRAGSAFQSLSHILTKPPQQLPSRGRDGLPSELADLCQLNGSSTETENPYFLFAHKLARFVDLPPDQMSSGFVFVPFQGTSREVLLLLNRKDRVALSLLYRWYLKSREYAWWIDFRARYEMPAIYRYLEEYHEDEGKGHL